MRYSITSNLRVYQRIGKNMFSPGKSWILNTLRILSIPQNFWSRKGPEYLYQLFDVLPKQTTCEMKALHVIQVYIQQWFHDEQGAKFYCNQKWLWECTYLLVGDLIFKSKLLRLSCRNKL